MLGGRPVVALTVASPGLDEFPGRIVFEYRGRRLGSLRLCHRADMCFSTAIALRKLQIDFDTFLLGAKTCEFGLRADQLGLKRGFARSYDGGRREPWC